MPRRIWTIVFAILVTALGLQLFAKFNTPSEPQNFDPKPASVTQEISVEQSTPPSPPSPPPAPKRSCQESYEFICKGDLPKSDPTGQVGLGFHGEIRALRTLRNIVRAHPDWTSEKIEEELVGEIYTQERRAKTVEVFTLVRTTLHAFLESLPSHVLSDDDKLKLRSRVDQVELQLPPPASMYADAADLFTKNEVYYQRTGEGEIRLRVGGAYLLNASSLYNAAFTFAHELAHAIDPCELEIANLKPQIYQPLVQCFVQSGWVDAERSVCGPKEQVSEAFSDWIATQIVADILKKRSSGYSKKQKQISAVNAVRDLCEQSSGIDRLVLSHHQSPEVRINAIFSTQPQVAQLLDCRPSSTIQYCQLDKLVPSKETP